jgi:hypothetical protein
MTNTDFEHHPFLEQGKIQGATKLILGSFPVYACANPDNGEKLLIRNTEGTVRFFYGSCKNRFWGLYHQHVDSVVTVPVRKTVALGSLRKNRIAISDVIVSCRRKGKSSSDTDLYDKDYNVKMIQQMIQNGVSKVLCTSKGVLFDLNKEIISSMDGITLDAALTKQFADNFMAELNGKLPTPNKGICFVYRLNKRIIYALAIPSPGSPQRQAHNFGCLSKDKLEYANRYFEKAFKWLKK